MRVMAGLMPKLPLGILFLSVQDSFMHEPGTKGSFGECAGTFIVNKNNDWDIPK